MSASGYGSSCGACKFLRRKCISTGCVFAPYFSYEQGTTHFAAIHKVFGASNVSKLLSHLPMQNRREAAISISFEAQARIQDPIYGCVAHIYALQEQVAKLQEEIEYFATQMLLASATTHAASCGQPQEASDINWFQFPAEENITSFCDSYEQQTTFPLQASPLDVQEQYWVCNKGTTNQEDLPMEGVGAIERLDDILLNQAANQQNCSENFPFSMTFQEFWPSCEDQQPFDNVIFPAY
ncbi:hypothetical protein H6P81_007487 [Aristolochia fimbriata]|uniref:LOB domain-containing protein n=1 Tax=Aristolochia fimbriata TaxID=158543 RepID=A0AAV7F0L7_ARIFI|nr:hypothetical protein H6P81_007487 [Aristolochia fimbriata]